MDLLRFHIHLLLDGAAHCQIFPAYRDRFGINEDGKIPANNRIPVPG
jgi:hypothetical protein